MIDCAFSRFDASFTRGAACCCLNMAATGGLTRRVPYWGSLTKGLSLRRPSLRSPSLRVRNYLELPVEAEVGRVPVAATAEGEDVVGLNRGDDVVVTHEPVVATRVDPADVVATVGTATFVRHNSNQLVRSSVKSLAMRPIQNAVLFLDAIGQTLCLGTASRH